MVFSSQIYGRFFMNNFMRSLRFKKAWLFASALLSAFVPAFLVWALTWTNSTVDSAGIVGQHTSIALRSDGLPEVSYYDATNGDLKNAHQCVPANPFWCFVGDVDSPRNVNVGGFTAIALDGSNVRHFSYYDFTNGNLKYLAIAPAEEFWAPEIVDSPNNVGQYTSIAVETGRIPHISYYDVTNGNLKYARKTGTSWSRETVDSPGTVGLYTSIALVGSTPHISYYDATNGNLKYATKVGTSWSLQTVDALGTVGTYTSIAVVGSTIHISYFDATNANLKYATKVGSGSWSIHTVDSPGSVGGHSSIAVRGSTVHISYYDATNGNLKYARKVGNGSWTTETVDAPGVVGISSDIAVNASGSPRISYYDLTNGDLKIAFGSSTSASVWLTTSAVDKGRDELAVPQSYSMAQNYPNPFNPSTNIQFDLKDEGQVTLRVFNSVGQQVANLLDENLPAGRHSAVFDATGLPSGVYFYKLSVNGFSEVKRMELVK
jgi:hypothetical protein